MSTAARQPNGLQTRAIHASASALAGRRLAARKANEAPISQFMQLEAKEPEPASGAAFGSI